MWLHLSHDSDRERVYQIPAVARDTDFKLDHPFSLIKLQTDPIRCSNAKITSNHHHKMFGSPHSTSRHLRRRQQNYSWDHGYLYQSELTPVPSYEDLSIPTAIHTAIDLPSRVSALNRRAAIVSANLTHLTAVVKPLETIKPDDLSEAHLSDMWEEGVCLGKAMEEFKEQMEEVSLVLEELLIGRKKGMKILGGVGLGLGLESSRSLSRGFGRRRGLGF